MTRARLFAAAAFALASTPTQAANCSISALPVAFGGYNPLAVSAADAVGQVTVTCTNLVSLLLTYSVSLSRGAGSFASREMANGANRLRYNLYTDPTRLIVWGDGSAGTSKVTNTFLAVLLGVSASHTVYGRVPALQNVAIGGYSDTITATVEW